MVLEVVGTGDSDCGDYVDLDDSGGDSKFSNSDAASDRNGAFDYVVCAGRFWAPKIKDCLKLGKEIVTKSAVGHFYILCTRTSGHGIWEMANG